MTRLLLTVNSDPSLWARDLGGMLIRCATDTAITFCYLVRRGNDQEFQDFVKYGEGKEKLLLLHLQDNYAGNPTFGGETAEQISDELGSFNVETIDIELANWTKKSARDLAFEAGLEKQYRLAYDPASSELHGTWTSLKKSNLLRCAEPLHRFHRLPGYTEPPLLVGVVAVVQQLWELCVEAAVHANVFPACEHNLEPIAEIAVAGAPESGPGTTHDV